MKAVIQKVKSASVSVDNNIVSSIHKGLMILVGINVNDTKEEADKLSKKVVNLRLFEDENGTFWKKSVKDIEGEILCVSQFTLMAKTVKGTKPDFHLAQKNTVAKELYEYFLSSLNSDFGRQVADGVFGAMMDVSLVNDGPVTIIVDTDDKK